MKIFPIITIAMQSSSFLFVTASPSLDAASQRSDHCGSGFFRSSPSSSCGFIVVGSGGKSTSSCSKNHNNAFATTAVVASSSPTPSIILRNQVRNNGSHQQNVLTTSKMSENDSDDDDDEYEYLDDDEEGEDYLEEDVESSSASLSEAATYFLQSSGFSPPATTEASTAAKEAMTQKETELRTEYNDYQLQRARYLQPQNVLSLENELNEEWKDRQNIFNRANQRNIENKRYEMKADWMNRIVDGVPVKTRDRSKQDKWEEDFRNKMMKERLEKKQQQQQKEKEEEEQMLQEESVNGKEKETVQASTPAAVVADDKPEAEKAAAAAAEEAKKKEEEEARRLAEEEKARAEAAAAAAAAEEARKLEEQRIAAEKARAAEAAAKAEAEAEAERARLLREEQERAAAEAEAKAAAAEERRKQQEAEDALLQPLKDKATGIEFAPKLGLDQYLVGVGVRKKAIINIYSVGMYTSRDIKNSLSDFSRKSDKKEAVSLLRDSVRSSLTDERTTDTPFKTSFLLEMAFKVGAETMSSAIAESVEPRYKEEPLEVAELKDLIFAGVKAKGSATKGTTFLFECSSEDGLTVSVDGEVQGTVPSVALASAFVDVYLDEKAASPPLKDSILQYCCAP